MLRIYYLTLIGFLCACYSTLCQAAAVMNNISTHDDEPNPQQNGNITSMNVTKSTINNTSIEEPHQKVNVNTTMRLGLIDTFTCTKHRQLTPIQLHDAMIALDDHYNRGKWGQKCYGFWCVDARDMAGWESPKDCMNELRGKLYECLGQGSGDGYIEQHAGFATCFMHYWCNGC